MAIGERETTGTIVIDCRKIAPRVRAVEKDQKIAIVDTLFAFVQKNEMIRRCTDFSELAVSPPLWNESRIPTVAIHIAVHRDAADAGIVLSEDANDALVGRTFIYSNGSVV